ncbi:MAG: Tim44/TimA family putative adaptor protein [Pseudomonadota bacterium]
MDLTILIFAALALFLSYRLFNVLGTKGGHEPEEHERPVLRPVGANSNEPEATPATQGADAPRPVLPEWAQRIADQYPAFEPKSFLDGAGQAYEMIVEAYQAGDLSTVKGFIANDVLASFQGAIDSRNSAGQEVTFTLVGIDKPEAVTSDVAGDAITVEVKFRAEQVRFVKDADGQVVEGSEDTVVQVVDRWVFSRAVKSRDPNWTLVATQGSAA